MGISREQRGKKHSLVPPYGWYRWSEVYHSNFTYVQAHSSVEKAGLIGLVKMRLLPCDDELSLRGDTLQEAIDRDRKDGLIPFYVSTINQSNNWFFFPKES